MKSFALALFAASASASLSQVVSFDFSEYFTKTERKAKPELGSYSYDYTLYNDADTYGIEFYVEGDLNVQYTLPFGNTKNEVSWTLELIPEINLGGQQRASFVTPYIALDIFLDLWPSTITIGDTYLQWTPPLFADFCMSSGWSVSLLELALSMDVSLWECDTGVFDWILNGNAYNCGLATYTFNNDLYDLSYANFDMSGEFLADTCNLTEASTEASTEAMPPVTTPESTTTGLNFDGWN